MQRICDDDDQETKPNLPQREIYSFYQTVIEGALIPYLNTVKL